MTEQAGTDLVYASSSLNQRKEYAETLANAGELVPEGFRNKDGSPNPAKLLLAFEYGAMLGLHPVAALQGINVIKGKASPAPALMTALVRRAGHKLRVRETGTWPDTFKVTVTIVRSDDPSEPFEATWDKAKATRAKLLPASGESSWAKYPEAMCTWRAVSEAVRKGAEDVMFGAHLTPEELGATVNEEGEVIDVEIVEDHESNRNPGHNEGAKARLRDPGATGPGHDATRPADDRPRPSRTVETSGAGRTDDAADRHAIADEWATRAGKAITVTDARDLYRDANRRGILDYPLTTGELLGDVLRARGEHLADEEAHAAADEPLDIPEDGAPAELPW